ncbi:MspA family porin, partial [Nocardia farcinica]|uniref:MspA family porin n=1 Tax=Nocardia farcinica TaxID=37329 RepID=UPI003CC7EB45
MLHSARRARVGARRGGPRRKANRAGVVTFKAAAVISGAGSRPVGSGSIRVGYQVGCAIDVFSGITLGLT